MSARMALASADARLDVAVAACWPELSRSRATALVKGGAVTVDGKLETRPSLRVSEGAALGLELPELEPSEAIPQAIPIDVVYEDADIVVVNKAAGMVVHPAAGHADGTLVNALLHHVDDLSGVGGVSRPGIVHRLDKGTSGLLVVAKHDEAHRGLAAQFAEHSAGRTYLAITLRVPHDLSGTIESYLARHPQDRMRFASTDDLSVGRHAVTFWQRLLYDDVGIALLQVRLQTGRTHQIRVHLSEQGWPLLGDRTYGRRLNPPKVVRELVEGFGDRPMLHAWQLHFTHPITGDEMTFTAPPPSDFASVLAELGWTLPRA